jgi:hypothetical protein
MKYVSSIVGEAASTTVGAPNRVFRSAATGAGSVLAIHEISLSGEAASSSFVRFVLNRPAVATAGAAATTQAPQPLNPASAAASFTVYVDFTAGGGNSVTAGSVNLLVPAFNAFGGVYTWLAAPKGEIIIGGQGTSVPGQNVILYSLSGTPAVSGHFIIEQL